MDLTKWKGVPIPERRVLEGRYAQLEPLDAVRHTADLFRSALEHGTEGRFRYLLDRIPEDEKSFEKWIEAAAASQDRLFFAVINKETGRAEGRQALMRMDITHGVIEIGSILWGPAVARTRVATEAFYLHASYMFDTLGYRRLEWKCDDRNTASKRAAQRFGFVFDGVIPQTHGCKGRKPRHRLVRDDRCRLAEGSSSPKRMA